MRRVIRIKEFGTNIDRVLSPSEDYLSQTNGTIVGDSFRLRTDRNGFLFNPNMGWPTGDRVYILGDSFIENSFIEEGGRLCDVMTKLDAERGRRRFLNCGYSGSTSLHLFNVLCNKVISDADFSLVFVLPSNDIFSLRNEGGYWNDRDKRFSPIIPPVPGEVVLGDFTENLIQLKRMITAFVRMGAIHHFDLFLSTCPFVSSNFEELGWFRRRHRQVAVYEQLIEQRRSANRVVREVAEAEDVPLIDLERILADPTLFYDDVHVNLEGAAVTANSIISRLPSTDDYQCHSKLLSSNK